MTAAGRKRFGSQLEPLHPGHCLWIVDNIRARIDQWKFWMHKYSSKSSDSTIAGRLRLWETRLFKIGQGFKNGIYRMTCRPSGWIGNESGTSNRSHHSGNQAAVECLLEREQFFIEWTAGEVDIDSAAELWRCRFNWHDGSVIGNRSGQMRFNESKWLIRHKFGLNGCWRYREFYLEGLPPEAS